ncbi:unnamed protein product [Auanema sp. JU1783]|nr:unnamed protein product [Auanema sp. JU1783]
MVSYTFSAFLIVLLGVCSALPMEQTDDQAEFEQENVLTLRDRTRDCEEFTALSMDKTNPNYCVIFSACCNMNFDPLNGDKCQSKEVKCDEDVSVCVWRNCTELITTTTTTTLAPTTTQSGM